MASTRLCWSWALTQVVVWRKNLAYASCGLSVKNDPLLKNHVAVMAPLSAITTPACFTSPKITKKE